MGFREAVQREKFITIQSYFKKQEKHQIDYLTLYLKQLQKEGKKKQPKLVEGNKSLRSEQKYMKKEMKEMIIKISKTKS